MRTKHLQGTRIGRYAMLLAWSLASSVVCSRNAYAQSGDAVRGAALYQAREYAAARVEFVSLMRQNPHDAYAMAYLGRIASQLGSSAEAVDWLERAIAVNDAVGNYHEWLGAALGEEAGKASKFRQPFLARRVKTKFERAVELDPRSVSARFGLVQFYSIAPGFMGGSAEKARQEVVALAAISPLQGHLAKAWLFIHEKSDADATTEYEVAIAAAKASALQPDNPQARQMLQLLGITP